MVSTILPSLLLPPGFFGVHSGSSVLIATPVILVQRTFVPCADNHCLLVDIWASRAKYLLRESCEQREGLR